jgi:hypothetical protein
MWNSFGCIDPRERAHARKPHSIYASNARGHRVRLRRRGSGCAIYDPEADVRNNAMRVMVFMAQASPDRDSPLDSLLAAFDFPAATLGCRETVRVSRAAAARSYPTSRASDRHKPTRR